MCRLTGRVYVATGYSFWININSFIILVQFISRRNPDEEYTSFNLFLKSTENDVLIRPSTEYVGKASADTVTRCENNIITTERVKNTNVFIVCAAHLL
jgi:uncharacterized protein YbaA (DUF1428 family)